MALGVSSSLPVALMTSFFFLPRIAANSVNLFFMLINKGLDVFHMLCSDHAFIRQINAVALNRITKANEYTTLDALRRVLFPFVAKYRVEGSKNNNVAECRCDISKKLYW